MFTWYNLLQPKRFRDTESVTRSKSDTRSPFKKDFDTVCNSTILRRLQDKAQVFPLEQEDYARTRLTHSIEVMSIAESIGYQVISFVKEKKPEIYLYTAEAEKKYASELVNEIPNILKTAALLHDMGNPPFGHLGEKIIGDWFKKNLGNFAFNADKELVFNSSAEAKNTLDYLLKGSFAEDLKNFDGNAQLLRLVTKLCFVVDENGMNLTFPVISTFIKYPTASIDINKKILIKKKVGYFSSEEKQFNTINTSLGLNSCRHPLAFLLEAADDIAYLTADIEDAQRKGLISLSRIQESFENEKGDALVDDILKSLNDYIQMAKTMDYDDVESYVIHRLRVLIKGYMINAMSDAFEKSYELIMKGEFDDELINVSSAKKVATILRQLERDNIYYCANILENKTRANTIITKLLDVYIPAIVNYSEDEGNTDSSNNLLYLSLSKNYRHICKMANKHLNKSSNNEFEKMVYNKILLVTDQISGMTDSRALTVYKTISAN